MSSIYKLQPSNEYTIKQHPDLQAETVAVSIQDEIDSKLEDYSSFKNYLLHEAKPGLLEELPLLVEQYGSEIEINRYLPQDSITSPENPAPKSMKKFNLLQWVCLDMTLNSTDKQKLMECFIRCGLSIYTSRSYEYNPEDRHHGDYDEAFFCRLRDGVLNESLRPGEVVLSMMQSGISFKQKPDWIRQILQIVFTGTLYTIVASVTGEASRGDCFTQTDERILTEILRLGIEQGIDFSVPEIYLQPLYKESILSAHLPRAVRRICMLADLSIDLTSTFTKKVSDLKYRSLTVITTYVQDACLTAIFPRAQQIDSRTAVSSTAHLAKTIADYVFTKEAYASPLLKPTVMPILFNMRVIRAGSCIAEYEADEKFDNTIRARIVFKHATEHDTQLALCNSEAFYKLISQSSPEALRIIKKFISMSIRHQKEWLNIFETLLTRMLDRISDPLMPKKTAIQLIKFVHSIHKQCTDDLRKYFKDWESARHQPSGGFRSLSMDHFYISIFAFIAKRWSTGDHQEWLLSFIEAGILPVNQAFLIYSSLSIEKQEPWLKMVAFLQLAIVKGTPLREYVNRLISNQPIPSGRYDNDLGVMQAHYALRDICGKINNLTSPVRLMAFAGMQSNLPRCIEQLEHSQYPFYPETEQSFNFEKTHSEAQAIRLAMMPFAYPKMTQMTMIALQSIWQECPPELAKIMTEYTFSRESFVKDLEMQSKDFNSSYVQALYDTCVEDDEKEKFIKAREDKRVVQLTQQLEKGREYSDSELSLHFGVADGLGSQAKGVSKNRFKLSQPHVLELSNIMERDYLILAQAEQGTQKIARCVLLKKDVHNVLQYYNDKNGGFNELNFNQIRAFNLTDQDRCIQLGVKFKTKGIYPCTYATPTTSSLFSSQAERKFYQEVQQESLCGYHALNAFHGDRACSLNEYLYHSLMYIQREFKISAEELQKTRSTFTPLESADPRTLQAVLMSLSKANQLPVEYQNIAIAELSRVDRHQLTEAPEWKDLSEKLHHPAVDRIIVGWGARHFITLRKRKEGLVARWHVVDSLNRKSQDKTYDCIENCLMQYNDGIQNNPSTHFSFLYIVPKRVSTNP